MTRSTRNYLLVLVALTTSLRLALGYWNFGFHTGDDVEILRAAFMRVLDHPYPPWNIRNLLISDLLVAPVVALADALGVGSPRLLCWFSTFPFVALASLNVILVFALGRRWIGQEQPALIAATLYALHWMPLGYGSTVYPRTATTTCVLAAALLVFSLRTSWVRDGTAGALMSLALAWRFSEVIFLAPMAFVILLESSSLRAAARRLLPLGLGFMGAALLTVGIEDLMTWGRPFSSLIEFARYTLVERNASSFRTNQPFYWYLWRLPTWLPLTLLPFLVAPLDGRKLRNAATYIALPLLILSAIHLKQLRYLQGIMPFVFLMAATDAWSWWLAGRRKTTAVLLTMSVIVGTTGLTFLAKTSTAAVQAAQTIAKLPGLRCVGLSQAWAYGETIYLPPDIVIQPLPFRPTETDLTPEVLECGAVALYEEHVNADPKLDARLRAGGLVPIARFGRARSRPVVLYQSKLLSSR